ncbi:hypothetical protein DPMN_118647 [Dreissena polymorpha]|uniref:Uncharacterized protein n=1 Tax=Dreissena polymorpha TaxID=45954 RepID=A0A9D4GHR2_DREPO|nr:hypothetical protein DPMN_118647 [Dreissena polymorpha]
MKKLRSPFLLTTSTRKSRLVSTPDWTTSCRISPWCLRMPSNTTLTSQSYIRMPAYCRKSCGKRRKNWISLDSRKCLYPSLVSILSFQCWALHQWLLIRVMMMTA